MPPLPISPITAYRSLIFCPISPSLPEIGKGSGESSLHLLWVGPPNIHDVNEPSRAFPVGLPQTGQYVADPVSPSVCTMGIPSPAIVLVPKRAGLLDHLLRFLPEILLDPADSG